MTQLPVRKVVNRIGVLMALAIAVAFPLAYYLQQSSEIGRDLEVSAQLSVDHVSEHIARQGWKGLGRAIEPQTIGGEPVHRAVFDKSGLLVFIESFPLLHPARTYREPIVVDGEIVGRLDASVSLRPFLVNFGIVAAVSASFGFVLWLTVRLLAVSALDRLLSRLNKESARFEAALNNMSQGLCLFDSDGKLAVYNRRFVAMFGTPLLGTKPLELFPDRDFGGLFLPIGPALHNADEECAHELADGRVIRVAHRPVEREGWVATYEDITERRRTQEHLSHMARHDALTGLPNRVMFREHMQLVLPRVRRGDSLAVLCLDLDGFKGVNDTLGHPIGDELLRLVASRLRDNTRGTDLVARLGGDEFAIIQVAAEQPREVSALAERLIAAIRQPFEVQGHRIDISTSIGSALADETTTSSDELLRNADIALYRAKSEGRGICCFFEPGMDAEIRERHRLESDLRMALAEEQFEVFYQPLIEARDQALVGFEALLRWRHPTRGLIMPGDFVHVAEETNLIKPIGAWVLARACRDAAKWPEHVKIAVNLSPVQFSGGHLADEVQHALRQSGLAPQRLELEITESVMLQDTDATLGLLHRLRDLGVRIAMDDFGTGYSSLSYLRRFPFDKIKIDKSFVQNLQLGEGSIEIVRAVVGLGKALGMDVLAEGVETEQQLAILQNEGCDELQGYLFSRPRPLGDVPSMLRDHVAHEPIAAGP